MITRGEFTLIIASTALVAAAPDVAGPLAAETARQLNAFAVGYVLVMSILGTMFMQYSDVVERRVAAWRGDASE
jgi:CPA2 family monovalent cation:H+ antiporter-2